MTGGDRLGDKGFYIQPTIFSDVQVSFDCIKVLQKKNYVSCNCKICLIFQIIQKTKGMLNVHGMAVTGRHEDCSRGDIRACSVDLEIQVSIMLFFMCLGSEAMSSE